MVNVKGSADAIFTWGCTQVGGLKNRIVDTAKLYLTLLTHKTGARLTKDGVRHNSAHYWCAEMRKLYDEGQRFIDFIAHPTHEDEVFWISPDGVLIQLTMDELDRELIGTRRGPDQKLFATHQRMQIIEERKRGKSTASVSVNRTC